MAGSPGIKYPPDFEAQYQPAFYNEDGVAYTKAEREKNKELALFDWNMAKRQPPEDEIPEDPIASPEDTPAEALEKIVAHSLKSMTPSDAVKHRSQLLKFAGDTVLQERKAKIEKQAQATGLSMILELFQQVAEGRVKQGPGWIDATQLPTLSISDQATAAVETSEALDEPEPMRQAAQ